MPGARPDPWGPAEAAGPEGDVIEGGMRPAWWQRRWTALPRRARRPAVGFVVLLAVGTGGLWLRDRAADRALAERVDLAASVRVWSSSTATAGGLVAFSVVVRNEGPLPVWVTSVEGSAAGLRLRALDHAERRVAPDVESAVPVSIRLTCARYGGDAELTADIAVRRQDGGSVVRRVHPDPADALLDVATTLCAVRPDLEGVELSGPVLDGETADDPPR